MVDLTQTNRRTMRHYRQLTQAQRYQIEGLLKAGYTQQKIARSLGVSPATICRELKRNRVHAGYCGAQAQQHTYHRRSHAFKASKQLDAIKRVVLIGLELRWSPEQISGVMRRYSTVFVSHEWIYRFVARDKQQGGTLYQCLRQGHRKRRKRYGSGRQAHPILNRTNISERPAMAESREEFGHWEADTIIGKGLREAMVTLAERKTGLFLAAPLPKRDAQTTARAIIRLLKPYKDQLKSITYDNGTEFSAHEWIAKRLGCPGYFADPYSPWQRGTNENTNGLLRQYFPKGSSFKGVTPRRVNRVVAELNSRPRKRHQFYSPVEMIQREIEGMCTAGKIALIG